MKGLIRKQYLKYKSLKSIFLDSIFGGKNYNKFVIISDSRTGSTLLMQLLNSHPEIIAMGEVFKNPKGVSCRQIWNKIYRNRSKGIKWVGFKLFYTHPSTGNDYEVWDFLENDKEILVLHLTRKNILRSHVSRQIGLKTRQWTESVNKPHQIKQEQKKVKLDFKICLENLERISKYVEQTEEKFKQHKVLSVVYENLDEDKQVEMNRIYRAMGLSEIMVSTNMKKQNPESLENLIINYEEMKEKFMGTKWEGLLN